MTIRFPSGAVDISIDISIFDDYGIPVTGLVSATFPTVKISAGAGNDATIVTNDLALITTTHNDGGVKERGEGVYRLDLPDQLDGTYTIRGSTTNKHIVCPKVQIGYVDVNAVNWGGSAVGSVSINANVTQINSSAPAAARLSRSALAMCIGVVGSSSTTTSIISSSLTPVGVDADQFAGRVIIFDADTTTTGLRNQAADISTNTGASAPVFTVTALSQAPVNGDTFIIV